jgi:hypothetical protein
MYVFVHYVVHHKHYFAGVYLVKCMTSSRDVL